MRRRSTRKPGIITKVAKEDENRLWKKGEQPEIDGHTLRLFVDWSGGATAVIEESAKKIFNLPGTGDLQVEDT